MELAAAQIHQFAAQAGRGGSGSPSITRASLVRFGPMKTAPLEPGSAEAKATAEAGAHSTTFTAPTVSLPKGSGAIRGMGQKFAANPVTGSATFSIPIPASPDRNGFGPQLALRYDPASGNGPCGFGWSLASPSITRKTDKGRPRYRDDTDTFLISDAEDLVPVLGPSGEINDDHESVPGYVIHRFQPRIERTFALIERWTRDDGDVHWRSTSTDNVLSVFGKDDTSRIFGPANHAHVFSWLICEARDDKGDAVGRPSGHQRLSPTSTRADRSRTQQSFNGVVQ